MVAELYGTILQDINNRRRTPRVIPNRRRRAPWSEPQRGPAGERGQVADKKGVVLGARAKRSWRCWRWLTALAALVLYAVDGHYVVIGLALGRIQAAEQGPTGGTGCRRRWRR